MKPTIPHTAMPPGQPRAAETAEATAPQEAGRGLAGHVAAVTAQEGADSPRVEALHAALKMALAWQPGPVTGAQGPARTGQGGAR